MARGMNFTDTSGGDRLPLAFATLEAVDGGILVRFIEMRNRTILHPGPRMPTGESWQADDEQVRKHTVQVPCPVAVYCPSATPVAVLAAIERAQAAFIAAQDLTTV